MIGLPELDVFSLVRLQAVSFLLGVVVDLNGTLQVTGCFDFADEGIPFTEAALAENEQGLVLVDDGVDSSIDDGQFFLLCGCECRGLAVVQAVD